MDYKKFEENVYKYIIEYNKGSTKSITRVKKAKETLNITDKQLLDIILSFDNLLRKNIYKYSYNKSLKTGKSIYTKQDENMSENNVKSCLSKIYKIKPDENITNLSENTFTTKINGKNKIINFAQYYDYSIEQNYKNSMKRKFLYKELVKLDLIPKINDIIMCNNSNNSITHSVKMADTGYYIIIYDNPADYKKLNAENINKLSGEEKKTLFNNLELFAQKIFENKVISYTKFIGEYSYGTLEWIFFDNNLKIVIIITESYPMYNFNDKENATMNKNTFYKKLTNKIFNKSNNIQNLNIKEYVILRLLQEKQLIL